MKVDINNIIKSAFSSITIEKVGSALLTFIICYIVSKILIKFTFKIIDKLPFERTLKGFMYGAIKLLLYFITIIIVADSLGIDSTSLIALLSVVGIAVSLAIQGTLSNLANGLVILVSKPFVVGDYIEVGDVSGTVYEINFNYTKIVMYDNKVIYIPNSYISTEKIINYTSEPIRRVDINFSASYDSPQKIVKTALLEAVSEIPEFIDEPKTNIYTIAYNDSNIEYGVRAWTNTNDYWNAYFSLMDNVAVKFEKYNVEMTYNHINVHMIDK